MMHATTDGEPANAVELHFRVRAVRNRMIAAAIVWLVRRATHAILAYRTRQTLLGMRDEELRDVGLSRDSVERAGWF